MAMKILLISSNSSARGGGERYLVYLTMGLKELGCEVYALLSDSGYMDEWAREITAEGGIVYRRHLVSLRERPLRFLQAVLDSSQIEDIATFCKKLGPAAILVNQQYDEDGLDYLMGAIKSGCAVGGVMHMPMTAEKHKRPLGRLRGMILKKWYRKYFYKLILVSEGSREEFEAYYDAPRPTYIVNNSIPVEKHSSHVIDARIFPSDRPVVGFVGQFVQQKNLECLVQSWLKTLNKGIDSRLLLVGDGPERSKLEELLERYAPSDSWFITGWTPAPEEYILQMDLFLLSSHYEGLPLSLVEAVAKGVPAVVTPFNGAADVVRQAPWVYVTLGNSTDEIAAMTMDALKNLPSLKVIASEGMDEFKRYFSPGRMAGEILTVLGLEAV